MICRVQYICNKCHNIINLIDEVYSEKEKDMLKIPRKCRCGNILESPYIEQLSKETIKTLFLGAFTSLEFPNNITLHLDNLVEKGFHSKINIVFKNKSIGTIMLRPLDKDVVVYLKKNKDKENRM